MLCAGMLSVALVGQRRFFWAGLAGALAFLTWQPGLIFLAAALGCALIVPERKRAFPLALAGVLVPLAAVGAYLALNNAIGDMLQQAFGANANYFDKQKVAVGLAGVVLGNVTKLWSVSRECALNGSWLVPICYAGMLGGAAYLLVQLWRTRSMPLLLIAGPLLVSGAALFAFSLLDLQKCSDVTPLLPYLGLGGGAAVMGLAWLVACQSRLAGSQQSQAFLAASLVPLALVMALSIYWAVTQPPPNITLPEQRALAAQVQQQLAPDDAIQQFGDALILIAARRENATRYVHLGEKQGEGILTAEGVSVEELIAELDRANPRLVTLSRAKNKDYAAPLYAWIQQHYTADPVYNAANNARVKDIELYWRK